MRDFSLMQLQKKCQVRCAKKDSKQATWDSSFFLFSRSIRRVKDALPLIESQQTSSRMLGHRSNTNNHQGCLDMDQVSVIIIKDDYWDLIHVQASLIILIGILSRSRHRRMGMIRLGGAAPCLSKDLLQNNDFHITSSIFFYFQVFLFFISSQFYFSIPSLIVSLLPEFLAFCPNIFETGGSPHPHPTRSYTYGFRHPWLCWLEFYQGPSILKTHLRREFKKWSDFHETLHTFPKGWEKIIYEILSLYVA